MHVEVPAGALRDEGGRRSSGVPVGESLTDVPPVPRRRIHATLIHGDVDSRPGTQGLWLRRPSSGLRVRGTRAYRGAGIGPSSAATAVAATIPEDCGRLLPLAADLHRCPFAAPTVLISGGGLRPRRRSGLRPGRRRLPCRPRAGPAADEQCAWTTS